MVIVAYGILQEDTKERLSDILNEINHIPYPVYPFERHNGHQSPWHSPLVRDVCAALFDNRCQQHSIEYKEEDLSGAITLLNRQKLLFIIQSTSNHS